ncbi:helix-turn-helix domain-containing protein [Devosia sp. SL43]|uniref:helix-turn-helix domain-containing protein n=1 Tax=Devosia sp. SL43 TaxID=2806348 RepID=UPI001F45E5E5|nr:helix-turn-helix domain-containing protein [Devosia sp. SL43]UJW85493.1 chromosomal replication initiator DnaA [Devosia sp. SL43]
MFDSQPSPSQPRPSATAEASLCACDDVIALVAREKHVPILLLTHRSRCRASAARARQLAMYLSHVILGCSLAEVGVAFGRDRTTVSYACALIEDMRDDPVFDEEVSGFERRLEAQRDGVSVDVH